MFKWISLIFVSFWFATAQANICRWKVAGSDYKPRMLILSASEQSHSKTEIIVSETQSLAIKNGFEVEVISLKDLDPNFLKADTHFAKPLSLRAAHDQKFERADALLIVTPEYDGNASGLYYHYMNHMRANLTGLPVGIVTLAAGGFGGRQASDLMAGPLLHRKAVLDGQARLYLPNVNKAVNTTDKKITDTGFLGRLEAVLQQLAGHSSSRSLAMKYLSQEALSSGKINDFDFNSQVSVRGKVVTIQKDNSGRPFFMKWEGPVQLMKAGVEIPGQGVERHAQGFSTPVGDIIVNGRTISLTQVKKADLEEAGLFLNSDRQTEIRYASGIVVTGMLTDAVFAKDGSLQVMTFARANAKLGDKFLYKETWGPYDVLVAERLEGIRLNE